jgi:LAO/AO transport system kinase
VLDLVDRIAARDLRALARTISLIERDDASIEEILAALRDHAGPQPRRVGVTGAPGTGKSTLLSAMIGAARKRDRSVGVLAVDPTSPFSGGALLGDRLRMDDFLLDPDVYIRSAGARGQLGGLTAKAADVVWIMGEYGFDEVFVETVGAGQSEVDLPLLVDTTVVVLNPNAGDSIQLEKAGIIEVADIFVVNKADLPGANELIRDLSTMLDIGSTRSWRPPVVATTAVARDESIEALWGAIDGHRSYLDHHPDGQTRDLAHVQESAAALVALRARAWALSECRRDSRISFGEERSPHVVADRLLSALGALGELAKGPLNMMGEDP